MARRRHGDRGVDQTPVGVMLARLVVLLVALGVAGLGVARGTWAAGGSDSSCYALMADAWARGEWQLHLPLAAEAPWPDAARTFSPAGFIPSPVRADAASPICAPGFALLLAPLRAVAGPDGIFLLTPAAAGVVVWLTFALGRHLAGPWAGALAAIVVATTPVFLFQLMQPMNDVVATALWTAVVVLAALGGGANASGSIGALTGLAVLVRPNLAPAAVIVAGWVALTRSGRDAAIVAVCAAPFVGLAGLLNFGLYGHPLATGYGATSALFSLAHVAQNIRNYGQALFDTQLGFPLLGIAAAFLLRAEQRQMVGLVLALVVTLLVIYLLYTPFPEWWYLRFFLPVLPALSVLAVAALLTLMRRTWPVAIVITFVAGFALTTEAASAALHLHELEQRFRTTAHVARERLPARAIFITIWESGSVKYHAGREAILWDSLEPAWFDRAIEWLRAQGFEPFLVLEDWEEPGFRTRFQGRSVVGDLDWPPRFVVDRRVRIFNPADRARHLAGESVPTEVIWGDRR